MQTKRLFTGIRIPADEILLERYARLREKLGNERIKWVETENLHLTLWFFGNTNIGLIPLITRQLSDACQGFFPFEILIKEAGSFGSAKKPSVIWFGTGDPSGELTRLFTFVKSFLEQGGFKAEERDFRPHLTIGRPKGIKDAAGFRRAIEDDAAGGMVKVQAGELILFESMLDRQGPVYREVWKSAEVRI